MIVSPFQTESKSIDTVEYKLDTMGRTERPRSNSFAQVDETQASGILTDVLAEHNVFLGGSSIGKGLPKAARYYLRQKFTNMPTPSHFNLSGSRHIVANEEIMPVEDSFYVLDLGVVVSQVYQWRRFFPRVQPFYAVKCNPDPVIIKTLAILGCNFDCASRNEFRMVGELTADLPRKPEIIFANPCKPRSHMIEAVCKGITMVTFDNAVEIEKCAAISKSIELVMRIITDDRGSQCRLSSKFGAPRAKWESLLNVAHHHGMKVVGVSFHVGSGCRDASRYEAALNDAKEIFELAQSKFGMKMNLVDIGGGFPGETHSLWNPADHIDDDDEDDDDDEKPDDNNKEDRFMFFTEIAEQVAPVLDRLFPEASGVRIIAEPGRYFVAAAATLCCTVLSSRQNIVDDDIQPEKINDAEYSQKLNELSREDEMKVLRQHALTLSLKESDEILQTIQDELADYSKLFASQLLTQQEVDVYGDKIDLYDEGFTSALNQLGPPSEIQLLTQHHTVEGMNYQLVAATTDDAPADHSGFLTLAAAGEAAVNGVVIQAVADSAPLQDDYAYYISDGVYGAFNNIMFDHATCRPRVLRTKNLGHSHQDGIARKNSKESGSSGDERSDSRHFYTSTVFGPTCDSIDVICRSVLLPKLHVGDWLYFTNMGAYTMAAASAFNGFTPSEIFYVCSVMPEYFEAMIAGPDTNVKPVAAKEFDEEEKKEE